MRGPNCGCNSMKLMEIRPRFTWPRGWNLLRREQAGSLPWWKQEEFKWVCCG